MPFPRLIARYDADSVTYVIRDGCYEYELGRTFMFSSDLPSAWMDAAQVEGLIKQIDGTQPLLTEAKLVNAELAGKVQYLVDYFRKVLPENSFTFPDGDTWHVTE